jgi:methylated-DNA-protein-cysteine methyltransferase related protein
VRGRHPYARIWAAVVQIPRGRVSTYGQIARLAGLAGQPRQVGYALHHLPPGIDVPWHRVISARGEIALSGESGTLQRRLLQKEGVVMTGKRIDLERFGWPLSRRSG